MVKNCELTNTDSTCDTNDLNRVNRTVFVDSRFGNDETGVAENISDPVKTIKKAVSLVKKNRSSKQERWVISVRPGKYVYEGTIPNNVNLTGSGLATQIFGKIIVTSNCEFTNFNLIGTSFPCVDVNFKSKYENAVALFFGVDIGLSPHLNSEKGIAASATRIAVQLNSRAVNSNVVFKDSRLGFNLDIINAGINKFIVVIGGRVQFFTCFITTTSHPSVPTSIITNMYGYVDVELATIVHRPPVNVINAPVIFYESSSPYLFFSNNTRLNYAPKVINSSKNSISNTTLVGDQLPMAVIGHLAKNYGVIKTRNLVINWQGVSQEQDYIAYVTSNNAFISTLNYETSHGFAGNIGGSSNVTDFTKNIKYIVSNDGVMHQSGGTISPPTLITSSSDLMLHPTLEDTNYVSEEDVLSLHTIVLPQIIQGTNLSAGWILQSVNKSNVNLFVQNGAVTYTIPPKKTTIYILLTLNPLVWEQIGFMDNEDPLLINV